MATGIVSIIRTFLAMDSVPSPASDTGMDKDTIKSIVKDILSSTTIVNALSTVPSNLVTDEKLESAIESLRTELQPIFDSYKENNKL